MQKTPSEKITSLEFKIHSALYRTNEFWYQDNQDIILRRKNELDQIMTYTFEEVLPEVPIASSGRHLHLTQETYYTLFNDYEMKPKRELSQPGQFVDERKVLRVHGPNGYALRKSEIPVPVSILGPFRKEDQFEVLSDDVLPLGQSIELGITPRMSGDLVGSGGDILLYGTHGRHNLTNGIIVPTRHVHVNLDTAKEYGIRDNELLYVNTKKIHEHNQQEQDLLFNVVARVSDKFKNEVHVSNDEIMIGKNLLYGRLLREKYI